MTDAVKKELFGPKVLNKTIQLAVKARIYYDEDPFLNENVNKVTKPMALVAAGADAGPQRITVVSQAAKGFSKRALMEQNEAARMSVYAIKTPEEEFLAAENTFLDPIFDEDHEEEFQNEDKALNDFIDKINEKFASEVIQNETDEEVLREKAKEAVFSIFEAQKIYYTAFYKTQSLNRFLRELLVRYNGKYRMIYKKYNRLREQFESNNIKKNLTALNTDESKRILKAIEQSFSELEVYKSLFRLVYDQEEVEKFKTEIPVVSQRKRELLQRVVQGINQKNSDMLHDDHKISLDYIVGKYQLSNRNFERPSEEDFDSGLNRGSDEEGADSEREQVYQDEGNHNEHYGEEGQEEQYEQEDNQQD
jgi:hypothetical protein